MNNDSKSIFIRQNEAAFVEVQKTASYCYRMGKIWATFLAIVSIVIPISINIIVVFVSNDIVSGILAVIMLSCFGMGFLLGSN